MNYEELLDSRTTSGRLLQLPFGVLHKQQIDGKFENVLDIRPTLFEDLTFYVCIKKNYEAGKQLKHHSQLHFVPQEETGSIQHLIVERGQFVSLAELLRDNPAVIGRSGFVDNFFTALLQYASWLHEQGIFHVCYSPSSILLRKGSSTPLFLTHGSFFFTIDNQQALYEGMTDYVAPEVLQHTQVDARSDIYSIGKLMQKLFTVVEMPVAYKQLIAKATAESPDKRYKSAVSMQKDIRRKNALGKSLWIGGALVVAALIGWGVYTELAPHPVSVAYVKPVKELTTQDMLDRGFDAQTELGMMVDTSLTAKKKMQQRAYEAKAESVFRRQYAIEAEKILSTIYNKRSANVNQKDFMAKSQQVTDALLKAQEKIAGKSAISTAKSQLIASQIIEKITEQKKLEMNGGRNTDQSDPVDNINATRNRINKQLYEK